MTAACSASAPAHAPLDWHQINGHAVHRNVRRLQARIVPATQVGRGGKVHAFQHLLTHSLSGKALAVRRVTEHHGNRTPGVDGETGPTPAQQTRAIDALRRRGSHPRPLRRVSMPTTHGTRRPLGIPMCPAYCISCANVLGIILAGPAYLSQLHGAQTVSLITAPSEWPPRGGLTADEFCVLPPHPGYYTTRSPRC
jgi:hypothetical protein